ncbi:hypothetical protein Dsin_020419 [Dipteronia sinensis]|uniref:RNase H type-1 domain-containing protein n=1 Tax=Dipteronia sinensis TaxID=43782 RepID=A0AAE0AAF1_9ROSI|nr:hypothetical protein Dsin_020419 [Dipteronia sinensis]
MVKEVMALQSSQQTMDMVRFRLVWWFKYCGKGSKDQVSLMLLNVKDRCVDNSASKVSKAELWSPPAEGLLFFNVDGSAVGTPGPAGIGGVLRDSSRKVLCLFSFHLGIQDPITAELMAINKACGIVHSSSSWRGRKLVISSYSKVAVSWVNSKDFDSPVHVESIYEIRNWLRSLVNTEVVEFL